MSPGVARRLRAGTAVLVVLLAVVALVLAVTRLGGDGSSEVPGAGIVPASAPSPPPALPERGSLVDAVVQSDGTVRVTHWLRTGRAIDQISLAVPDASPDPAVVDDLRVLTSQGQLVLADPRVDSTSRVFSLRRPTLLVRLDYTLTGVVQRSGDAPGRALLEAVSMSLSSAADPARSVVRVAGQRILSLACSRSGADVPERRPCGRPRADGWAVDLRGPAAEDVVVAQVDLDREGS